MSLPYYPRSRSSSIMPSSSYAQLPRTSSFGNLSSFTGGELSRSRSATAFHQSNRTYLPSSYYTPSYQRYSVVGSTPKIMDRYPYVKYSTVPYNTQRYAYTPNTSLLDYSLSAQSNRRDRSYSYGSYRTSSSASGGFLDDRLNSRLRASSYYATAAALERPRTPARNYVKYMDLDDAVDLYKNRFLTSGALSKYWLSTKRS